MNTSIAVDWFWHSGSYALKSLSTLKTVYYNSIGNDANILLNLLPDNRGLIPNDQINLLKSWTNWIDSSFTKNWANGATAEASSQVTGHEADKIIDNKRHTYWTPSGTWSLGTIISTPNLREVEGYTKTVKILPVYRTTDGNINDNPVNIPDPTSRKIIVNIAWKENGQVTAIDVVSYVSRH